MLKHLEKTGKNEEEAIGAALLELGLDRDDVSVEVLERAKSGFLGIGSSPARVKVSYEAPDEPAPPPVQQVVTHQQPVPAPMVTKETPSAETKAADIVADPVEEKAGADELGDRARDIEKFLTGLMEQMEVKATPKISMGEDGSYKVELVGEGLGALIGRRGETLDAIQQLTGYAVNRGARERRRIHVDAENYRLRREESLERLAKKVAGKVVKYHRNVTLEPMNAYERHVIHAALQDYPDVTTYSTGTEPNRRTVVAYARGDQR